MSVLELAKQSMGESVRTGTSGMKLITHIEQMLRHQDMTIKIYESMDSAYAGNMTEALGEEGMAEALKMYYVIKECRVKMAELGA